jgi:hypothetical protein
LPELLQDGEIMIHILLSYGKESDTIFVVCHWHYLPTEAEQKAMIETIEPAEEECIFYLVTAPEYVPHERPQ